MEFVPAKHFFHIDSPKCLIKQVMEMVTPIYPSPVLFLRSIVNTPPPGGGIYIPSPQTWAELCESHNQKNMVERTSHDF